MIILSSEDWVILRFTLGMSALSVLLIWPWAVALAWVMARGRWFGKSLVETLVTLPIALPPVATGLLLLHGFGKHGVLGRFFEQTFGIEIIFTWKAVVLALSVMSFPFLYRTSRVAFEEVNPRLEQMARTLGAGPWRVFLTITLPLASHGIVAGTVLAFARALGEFGATVLVAGIIPGKTATLSLSIYQSVQMGHEDQAFRLILLSVFLSFAALWFSEYFLRRRKV
jgi:molybdate transport system permease protein